MSALDESLERYYLIRRSKAGLEPTKHLPDRENPDQPRCHKNAPKGYRRIPRDAFRLGEICGSCLGKDRVSAPSTLVEILEDRDPSEAWPIREGSA